MRKEPQGIDGWLGVLWIGLVLITPAALIESGRVVAHTQGLKAIVIALVLAGYSVFAGIRLRRTVKPARTFLKVMIGLSCVGMLPDIASRNVRGLLEASWGFMLQILWLVYLYRSVRVRNTYPLDFGIAPQANK